MGILLKGKWWIVLGYLGGLFFNIFGEEFWWRGYILPRQELVMGKYALKKLSTKRKSDMARPDSIIVLILESW